MRFVLLLFFVLVSAGGFLVQPQYVHAAAPVCDFFYVTPYVVEPNDPITFNWETTGATGVQINNGVGVVAVDGTQAATAPGTTGFEEYELTMTYDVSGVPKNVTCSAYINVVASIGADTPICESAYVSPATVNPNGTATAFWDTTNATQVEFDGSIVATDGSGGVTASDIIGSDITGLVARNFNGVSTTTLGCPVLHNVYSPTIDLFESAVATVTPGGLFTVNWDVYGDSYMEIYDDEGDDVYTSFGNAGIDSTTLTATTTPGTYEYLMLVSGNNFEGGEDVYASTTIEVVSGAPPAAPVCTVFTATPDSFVGSGSSTLAWEITNATSVSIDNGIGVVAAVDSTEVFLSSDAVYELTAVSAGGTTTCAVSIDVSDPPSSGGSSGTRVAQPQCVFFEASSPKVPKGEIVTLSFETKNADLVTIYEGAVSENKTIYTVSPGSSAAGAAAVTVDQDATYTLVAERGSRSDDCSTSVQTVSALDFGGFGQNEGAVLLTEVPDTGYEMSVASKILLYVLLVSGTLFVLFVGMHIGRLGIFATQSTVKYGAFTPISAAADHALRVHRTRAMLIIAILVVLIVLLIVQLI